MLQKGFLATSAFYASYAHKQEHIKAYFDAVEETFAVIRQAIEDKRVEKLLKGPAAHNGFYRLT